MEESSTIAALATAPQPAGLAVIRISGTKCLELINKCFKSKTPPKTKPRQLILGSFINPETEEALDQCLAVYMPAPNTFTGEDTVELNLHGSPLLARRVLNVLYANGAVPAEPGEFTKRAFMNGKLDLLQAEAVCDMIHASGTKAQRLAKEQLAGRFSNIITQLADPLRDSLAELEAHIDFPEEDIEPQTLEKIQDSINNSINEITKLIQSYRYGKRLKEGLRVLLWGRPNAGKSTLLNLLLNEERAIVTNIPGTTRDIIEEAGQIDGYSFVFCDCAGIQTTDNAVEKIGIERAIERLNWADVVLFIIDTSEPKDEWQELLKTLQNTCLRDDIKVFAVLNKIDLPQHGTEYVLKKLAPNLFKKSFHLSAKNGQGFNELKQALLSTVDENNNIEGAEITITEERHKLCLEEAKSALLSTSMEITNSAPLEIICAELRRGLSALEELIGVTTPDDILGRIFSKFCIGK